MSFGRTITLAVERIVKPVEGMHLTIAGRCFTAVGAAGKPVQAAHDTISHTVYGSIRVAGTLVGYGLDRVLPSQSTLTDRSVAIANGLWGDRLGSHREGLEIPMGLRDSTGDAVQLGPDCPSVPNATGHLVLLVHGFADTERCWRDADDQKGIADQIDADPSMTQLSVRYSTGQRVAVNGAQLADLIEHLHTNWPEPIESISLVGHSMGGLVARSACTHAHEAGQAWVADASQLITLGSPYLGTPLEKFTSASSWGLNIARTTRPLAEFLDTRSRGIKDLRFGATVGDLPVNIEQHVIAGVTTADPSHLAGFALGDLVVRANSAIGRRRIDGAEAVVFGGVRHNDLTSDERVVDRVMDVLSGRR